MQTLRSKVHTPSLTTKLLPFFLPSPTVPARRRPGRRKPFFEKFGTLLKQRSDAFLLHVNSPVPPHGEESDTPPPANGTAGPGGGGPAGPSSVAVILGPAGILGPPIATNGDASPGKLGDAENYVSRQREGGLMGRGKMGLREIRHDRVELAVQRGECVPLCATRGASINNPSSSIERHRTHILSIGGFPGGWNRLPSPRFGEM